MSEEPTARDVQDLKIVFCHLDSLSCLPALNLVFSELGDRIGLVVSSRRFGSKHGSFWQQTARSIRDVGWRLTLWFGFDLISVQVVSRIARPLAFITRRRPALGTLADLAERCGARLVEATSINSGETLSAVAAYRPDLVVVMNFDQILAAPFIALPRIGVLNIHPSLLPSLRGPCPVIWALAEQRAVSGATIHVIEDGTIDAGRVLAQFEVPLRRGLSVAEVNTSLFLAGAVGLPRTIEEFVADSSRGRAQDLRAGRYLGFPTAADMALARRDGLRLCRLRHALHLIAAALGLAAWKLPWKASRP
jgi:folate-dependent phosphoribosylglycinamide formyltransferase PurN